MSGNVIELPLLLLIASFTAIAAIFATLSFFRTRLQAGGLDEQTASRILRLETDIVRSAIEAQARGLREELGRILAGFQEVTLTTFATMRDGIDAQVRGFGERLDHGAMKTEESVAAISTKLAQDME